ncbi:MAG: hypothetical protein QOI03_1209 [Solirubrobacteraceae bacterium]|jgi:hypothetical protein|nr:hypothetical protein [Solirubrobacteraceae bacterium]
MPTASTTKVSGAKARTKVRRKAKPAAAKASSTRRTPRRKTAAKASRASASRTRAVHQAESAVRQTQFATRDTASVVGDYAEKAVLIPVGAALIAREKVVSGVSDAISSYSSTSRTQAQLRRFERRGATARNRLERDVRKARVRVERELRVRRRRIEKSVNGLDARRDAVAKNGSELANRVQDRILSLV